MARECERDLDSTCHPPCGHDDHGCGPQAFVIVHVADVLPRGRRPQRPDASEALKAEAILELAGLDSTLARACIHLDRVLDDVAGRFAERPQVLLVRPGEVLLDRSVPAFPQRCGHAAHEIHCEGKGLETPVGHCEVHPPAPQGATSPPC